MRILKDSSVMVGLLSFGLFGMSCSSETDTTTEGLQCGDGTVEQDGYCVPIVDASVDTSSGGTAGMSGTGGSAGGAGGAAGGTGGNPPDDAGDAQETSLDAGEDSAETVSCTGTCGSPGCGTCPTIPVVSAQMPNGDAYGIDAYETSVAEYQVFLDANVPKQTDEACEWNETYEPNPLVFDFPNPDMPVHAVDWCDARAYCEWAGKRLCKGSSSYLEDATKSEWYNACTLGGIQEYPYGDTYDSELCPSVSTPYSPGSRDTCEGGYPDLFDMAANMSEWTDECQKNQPGYATMCTRRGASYGGSTTWFSCLGSKDNRQVERANAGIRCCVDQ